MSPALLAALAQGAIALITYLDGLPAQERQAAIDALNAARTGAVSAVAAFDAGSAADLAAAQAELAQLKTDHATLAAAHADLTAKHEALVAKVVDAAAQP